MEHSAVKPVVVVLSVLFLMVVAGTTRAENTEANCILISITGGHQGYLGYKLNLEKDAVEAFNAQDKDLLSSALKKEKASVSEQDKKKFTTKISEILKGDYAPYEGCSDWQLSPDRKKIAAVFVKRQRHGDAGKYWYSSGPPYILVVMDTQNEQIVYQRVLEKKLYIDSIAWDPQSKHLGVIVVSPRRGYKPQDLFMGGGHPAFYNTMNLIVLDIASGAAKNYPVIKDKLSASGHVFWTEDKKCNTGL